MLPESPSSPYPIACLYGASTALFVEPVVADLQRAAAGRRQHIQALTIEAATAAPERCEGIERLYVLPFDVPVDLSLELPLGAGALLRSLFPRAEILNAPVAHELCWDKIATARRLLDRGVPMPATMITHEPAEAREFIRQHSNAILKEPRSCGGHGHLVVFADEQGTIVGESFGRRYVIELEPSGAGRTLRHGVLSCPPPFYLQRLVCEAGRGGVLKPAQILRAYIVEGEVALWTERYRSRIRRPSDFIINVAFGAKYKLLPAVGDASRTLARRAAEVLDVRVGAVDLIRTAGEGPTVLEVDTDGQHMMIDRSFKLLPEFRSTFDFDNYIAESLATPAAPIWRPGESGAPRARAQDRRASRSAPPPRLRRPPRSRQ